MFISGIKEGENYKTSKKTIVIVFTDYEIERLKDIKEYRTTADFFLCQSVKIHCKVCARCSPAKNFFEIFL